MKFQVLLQADTLENLNDVSKEASHVLGLSTYSTVPRLLENAESLRATVPVSEEVDGVDVQIGSYVLNFNNPVQLLEFKEPEKLKATGVKTHEFAGVLWAETEEYGEAGHVVIVTDSEKVDLPVGHIGFAMRHDDDNDLYITDAANSADYVPVHQTRLLTPVRVIQK